MYRTPLRIGIAVVFHREHYLIGLRPPGKPLAGYSEFPGGKCEGQEPSDVCAVRECHEETGLVVIADTLLLQHRFRYPHGELDLSFWECRVFDDTKPITSDAFRWVSPTELFTLTFPEANAPLIELLRERHQPTD